MARRRWRGLKPRTRPRGEIKAVIWRAMPVGVALTAREVQDRAPTLARDVVRRYLSAAVAHGWLRNVGSRRAALYVREV